MNPTYNHVQQVFALNIFSNYASSKKAPVAQLQSDLTKIVNALLSDATMQQLIGTWEVVWGPVVGSYGKDVTSQVASNAMFVAKNNAGVYVVATSGTNPSSSYGWLTEDFDVQTMVAWDGADEADPAAPRISSGTSTGLGHLLAMQSNGITLAQFLQNTFSKSTRQDQLIVTGHSLGGALSSTLALKLFNTQQQWNPSGTVIVSAEPTAGASPGNLAFSKYYSSQIGSRTLRFWNKLDPVPHGWQPDMMQTVPFLYYPYYSPCTLLEALTALAFSRSIRGTASFPEGGYYTQLLPQTPPLPGQVNITLTQPLTVSQVIQVLADTELKKILAKLGVSGLIASTVVTIFNAMLQHFENTATVEDAIEWMRHELEKVFGKSPYLQHLLDILGMLLKQMEEVLIFLLQLAYQHVTSYYDLMGMKNMHNVSQAIIAKAVSNGTLDKSDINLHNNLFNPYAMLASAGAALSDTLLNLLTPELIEKLKFPSIPADVTEPTPL